MVQPLTMGDLAGVIEKERGRIAAGSTIVLVASLIPEPLAAGVRRLAAEGHPVTVIGTSERVDTSQLGEIPFHSVAGAFRTLEERE
ncbi:MAG: hypothetical protein U5Q44_14445 [Dehalococcoidia bacterium]|nr:hypothetical protein [Dehalococcoidia bacterium]